MHNLSTLVELSECLINYRRFSTTLKLAKGGGAAVSIIPASLTELKQIKAMKNAKK